MWRWPELADELEDEFELFLGRAGERRTLGRCCRGRALCGRRHAAKMAMAVGSELRRAAVERR